jgi:hypothetical protein
MDEKSLSTYISDSDHGLLQEKTINGVTIKAIYRPQDFLVKQEIDAGLAKTDSSIAKLREEYHKQIYFLISLSKNNQEVLNSFAGDRESFSEMINRLAFGIGENITLTTSESDTLEMVDFVYPRMYGMSNSTDILLAFKNKEIKNAEYLKLTLDDLGLQTGNVAFKFKIKDITRTPNLKLR